MRDHPQHQTHPDPDQKGQVYHWADADILDVLNRRFALDQSVDQIAAAFGVSKHAVAGLLRRGRICRKPGSRMAGLMAEHDRCMAPSFLTEWAGPL